MKPGVVAAGLSTGASRQASGGKQRAEQGRPFEFDRGSRALPHNKDSRQGGPKFCAQKNFQRALLTKEASIGEELFRGNDGRLKGPSVPSDTTCARLIAAGAAGCGEDASLIEIVLQQADFDAATVGCGWFAVGICLARCPADQEVG